MVPGFQKFSGRQRTSRLFSQYNAPSTGGLVVTLMARWAATRSGMFSSNRIATGCPMPTTSPSLGSRYGMVRFSGEWVSNVIRPRGDAAESEGLRVQRVTLVVPERLGGGPAQAVGAQLARHRVALLIGQRDRTEHAVLGGDRDRLVHRPRRRRRR